jgi:hypothetical protein
MYEHRKQPLASRSKFYARLLNNIFIAVIILSISLFIGIVGYHFTEGFSWLDSVHQSSMILGGMGPVIVDFKTTAGKLFSSAYALFCGIIFITNIGIILAPIAHRLYHRLHMEE